MVHDTLNHHLDLKVNKLDIEAMKKAITYFIGTHDFRAFVTENSIKDNCVRTITNASITLEIQLGGMS